MFQAKKLKWFELSYCYSNYTFQFCLGKQLKCRYGQEELFVPLADGQVHICLKFVMLIL